MRHGREDERSLIWVSAALTNTAVAGASTEHECANPQERRGDAG